jgi:L-amino acid N-acyltransferase YncA
MTAIRLARPEDVAGIHAIYAPVVAETAISFEATPPPLEELQQRVINTLALRPWLVYAEENRVWGYAYASAYHTRAAYQWSVEVTVYVHPDAQRRGIARRLYTSLFSILCAQGYINAVAVIALPNPASVRLHDQFGFEPVGVFPGVGYKFGVWRDVLWMRRQLQPPPDEPVSPRPLSLLNNKELESFLNPLVI